MNIFGIPEICLSITRYISARDFRAFRCSVRAFRYTSYTAYREERYRMFVKGDGALLKKRLDYENMMGGEIVKMTRGTFIELIAALMEAGASITRRGSYEKHFSFWQFLTTCHHYGVYNVKWRDDSNLREHKYIFELLGHFVELPAVQRISKIGVPIAINIKAWIKQNENSNEPDIVMLRNILC